MVVELEKQSVTFAEYDKLVGCLVTMGGVELVIQGKSLTPQRGSIQLQPPHSGKATFHKAVIAEGELHIFNAYNNIGPVESLLADGWKVIPNATPARG